MTTGIALQHPSGEAAIAADSLVTGGCAGYRLVSTYNKIRAGAGALRVIASGAYSINREIDLVLRRFTDTSATVEDFAEALRHHLLGGGQWNADEETGPKHFGFDAVAVDARGVAHIGPDCCVVRAEPGWPIACGSGGGFATAAALALLREDARLLLGPEAICRAAVAVAITLDPGSGGEIWCERIETGRVGRNP